MTDSILAIDPGESSGWSLWAMDPDFPVQRLEYGLIKGGLAGFIEFMELRLGRLHPDLIICERFNRDDGRKARANLEPLPIEGAVAAIASALGIEVVWQLPSMKDQCHDRVLKEQGWWISNKEAKVDPAILWQDARDVNDSQIHMLAYAKLSDHEPTIALCWPPM